jgi:hypothetical protein
MNDIAKAAPGFVILMFRALHCERLSQIACRRARRRGVIQFRKALVFSGSKPAV